MGKHSIFDCMNMNIFFEFCFDFKRNLYEAKWIFLWFRDKMCPGPSVLQQGGSSLQEGAARAEKLIALKHNPLM